MSPATVTQEVARIIRALDVEFERYANARDAHALSEAFYAEDAVLLPPNSPPVRGKADIRRFWEVFLAAGPTGVRLLTGDVNASGDLAYGVGAYEFTLGSDLHSGKYIVVYRRQPGGGYKAVADSFSDNS